MNKTQNDLQLFAELYDEHPQAIVWLSPLWSEDGRMITDFVYAYCNDEGLRYLNISRQHQQRGLYISNSPSLSEPLRQKIHDELIQVYLTSEKSETNFYNPVLNKYVRVLRTRLRDGILTVVQDRTEENRIIRQLEEKTKELEEKNRHIEEQRSLLDNILKNSSNGISVSQVFRDDSGKVIDALTVLANDAAVRFIGFPREIYLTKRATEIEPAVMGSPYYQACINTLETGEPFVMQYQMQSTGRWLELTVSKLDYNHLIHVFTDVTPIREAQVSLERTARQLQAIINRTQSGVFTLTPVLNESGEISDFRFVLVNRALSAYVQQSPEALMGELGSRWFPGYMTNGLFALYCDTYLHHRLNRSDYHYNADGIDAWIDMQCTRFEDEVLVTFTDYTPVKKLQLELQKTVEELKRSNQSLEEFAYAASHDLQEPLRKIQTFSDKLRRELYAQLSDSQQMLFERMNNATRRMRQLIDDLLTYARVSRGQATFSPVDLNQVVNAALQNLETSVNESGAVVTLENLTVVNGDEGQLRQLFQNLLGNAVKYRKPNVRPVIRVNCHQVKAKDTGMIMPLSEGNSAYYQIDIADNGIGFEPQYAQSIFELFNRLHGRAEYEGTGIGLAIVQRVAQNHGGFVTAEGAPEVGATFHVFLPV